MRWIFWLLLLRYEAVSSSALKMDEIGLSETLITSTNKTAMCHNPENCSLKKIWNEFLQSSLNKLFNHIEACSLLKDI
jgi:hypothetical protein